MGRSVIIAARRPNRLALACFGLVFSGVFALFGDHANAQSLASCEVNKLTELGLASLKDVDEKVRLSAGRSLVDNWRSSVPGLIVELGRIKKTDTNSWSESEQKQAIFLTEIMRTILSSNDASIALFRQCDNDKVIKTLAWAARGSLAPLRLNAASILANTVDNTTVCFILHHLHDPSISVNGRANMLGITVAVASYAYKENVDAIKQTLAQVQQHLDASDNQLTQTKQLIVEISSRALKDKNADTPLPVALKEYCFNYDYAAPLD